MSELLMFFQKALVEHPLESTVLGIIEPTRIAGILDMRRVSRPAHLRRQVPDAIEIRPRRAVDP